MEELIKQLASKDREQRVNAVMEMLYEGSEEVIPLLKELLLTEKDLHVISAAVKTVGLVGGPEELEFLSSYLVHSDARIRANAVEALGIIDTESAVSLSAAMISDEHHRVRLNSAILLLDESPELVNTTLQEIWDGDSDEGRAGVLWAACNLSEEERKKWVSLGIKHSSENVRGMARLVADYDPDAEDDDDSAGIIKSRVRLVKKKRKLYIRLAGRVVEGVKKDPVKQVTIRLANSGIQEVSDRHGRFCFDRLEGNKVHIFVCEKIGWPTTTFRLRCTSQREQRTIIRMRNRGIKGDKKK